MDLLDLRRDEYKKNAENRISQLFKHYDKFYIFGNTEISGLVSEYILQRGKQVAGIISDDGKSFTINIPVVQLTEADKKIPVFSCALLRVLQSRRLLEKIGFNHVIDYFELNLLNEELFKFPSIDNNYLDIAINFPKYQWLSGLFEDSYSKEILDKVIRMRFNNQLSPELKHSVGNQYFDVLTNYSDINVFIDCGGYHGETSASFIRKNPNYKKIYFFEPFPDAMLIAKNELFNHNVDFIQKAVYDKKDQYKLTTNREDGNAISLNGDIAIETCLLDDEISDKIDFIKLDIEGSELNALHGAEKLIRNHQPIITVAIYHKQAHFWEIPHYLLSVMPGCKLFLRHNNDGIYETILHVIPTRYYNNISN